MKTTSDYIEERISLYGWLRRIEVAPLTPDEVRQLDREVIVRGLARLDEENGAWIMPKGRQFLFQFDCEKALQLIEQHMAVAEDPDVLQWLLSERFVLEPTRANEQWEVTPRGRTWLETLGQLPCDINPAPQLPQFQEHSRPAH